MPSATKTKRQRLSEGQRALLEQFAVSAGARTDGPPLKIDRDKGIIYGVKVLGRYSRNSHGLTEAENGSEYSPECMRSAIPMYEGAKVKCNHPANRAEPGKERPIEDTFGVLRNARIESEDDGVRADLHYRKHHPMTADVLDDVERQLGLWGLSHNAAAKRERFDRASKRLVIEELAIVRSVDLVDKPATNRNLWESEYRSMPITLRELLESRRAKWSKARRKWMTFLLEDDAMAPMMDATTETDEGGDEDDALWSGFQAAIQKVLDSYKSGEIDSKEAGKKIADWIKAHDKLTGDEEPEAPDVEESDDDDKPKDKQESQELAMLKSREKVRELSESMGVTLSTLQVKAAAALGDEKERRQLIESFRDSRTAGGFKTPKSRPAGSAGDPKNKGGKGRETQESEEIDAPESLRVLMGD